MSCALCTQVGMLERQLDSKVYTQFKGVIKGRDKDLSVKWMIFKIVIKAIMVIGI